MRTVTAAEFQRHFGRYQDEALKHPLAITRNGRERVVILAVEEYHRLQQRDRQVLGPEDFTAADLLAIAGAEPPLAAADYNDEVDE